MNENLKSTLAIFIIIYPFMGIYIFMSIYTDYTRKEWTKKQTLFVAFLCGPIMFSLNLLGLLFDYIWKKLGK